MRRLSPALCLVLALPLTTRPSQAQEFGATAPPRVMMCRLQDDSGTGWVPDFLMLTRQTTGPHSGRIEVFDPILQRLVHRPVPAAVTADGAEGRSYGWALSGVRNQSGQYAARLDYRLTVRKSDGQAWLTARAQGYENTMQGQGRCLTPEG